MIHVMDRRAAIADAAIDVIADSGLRALTHRKLDDALTLPAGSTSYYFRSKADLFAAVIARITETSRAEFTHLSTIEGDPVEVTVRYLDHLVTERAAQLRARHVLMLDPTVSDADRAALAGSLFSGPGAVELFGDAEVGAGYIALCEGLVTSALGARAARTEMFRAPVVTYLKGAGKL
ncbi:hypothetical protein CH292_12060 [Rhodococcus sp. 14-2470-1a]|nr:hypothetical protein CH267_19625 [Rhodococcus sp. 06-621-2]OZC74424.1 hypothetical protein CH282_28005 [Rhodococcus sp. 06-418-1B]OZD10002.1 hypothetical protein CH280_22655 [Rhodococcus sp. 06-156-4C]OZD21908.1 hypothetical protein CH253_13295 [Rhodococcus sp. 06-156-3C]OZD24163.1 hypothetical protein CH248_06275 [Rhodococcus sp. 06-156-4a]OZD29364.1 hypothetical protein CH247_17870 [Rhodococcus sp. 06-156-3b]OZD29670.1 hypothetical protein CH284_26220 [Rhodococcus sp. 06-156-3]OZF50414.